MFWKKKYVNLLFVVFSVILFNLNSAYAQNSTRNVNVRANKPELIFRQFIINTSFDRKKTECLVYKPPDMIVRKKPNFGKIKIKKGVVIDHDNLSATARKRCKGETIKGTELEFTADRKGKVSFQVEVLYKQRRYEAYSFGNILFNVNVR